MDRTDGIAVSPPVLNAVTFQFPFGRLATGALLGLVPNILREQLYSMSALYHANGVLASVDFTRVKCPVDLTNKTGCIRADDDGLVQANHNGLVKSSRIAIGVLVPVGLVLGVLTTLWVFKRTRSRRQPSQQSPPDRKSFARTEIGVTKVYKQTYLELDGSPVQDSKKANAMPEAHSQVLPSFPSTPSPNQDIRHLDMMKKVKRLEQELEGSPTSELSGDATIGRAVGKGPCTY